MKTKLVILLLAISFSGFSQKNHSIDFIGSIDINYRTIHGDGNQLKEIIKIRNQEENTILLWRAGLNYNQRISQRLFFKTGLRIAALGYKNKKSILIYSAGFDNYPVIVPTEIKVNFPQEIEPHRSNRFWFLELPIALRYEFANKKLTPFVEAGMSVNYLLFSRHVHDDSASWRPEETYKPHANSNIVQLAATFAFGVNWNINQSAQLFAQPILRYHLNPVWNTVLKERLWSAGLELGLRKFLK